jgi:branched-chain amino acid transport system ATP-binding protein
MSVLENVMVGFHARTTSGFIGCMARSQSVRQEEKRVREKAREMLALVNLLDHENRSSSSLSFGDQKRLELARALVSQPKVILLDEPVAGLNPSETDEIADLILRQKSAGLTILLIEHDMDLIMKISDKIVVLNYGEKIAEGSPEQIQNHDAVISAYLGDFH